MTLETKLGKIVRCHFGFGGYDDAMFGASWTLGGSTWRVQDFWGTWSRWRDGCEWTVEDQAKEFVRTCYRIRDLLEASGKKSIEELSGVPIEAAFDGNLLKSWRILTEVL